MTKICFKCGARNGLVELKFTGRITDFDGIFYAERTAVVYACRGHGDCYYATLKNVHKNLQAFTDPEFNDMHDVTIQEATVKPPSH